MSQVYFDDTTNEYFYYGDEDTADPGDVGENYEDNNLYDNNIKPVPNASIKRGKNTYRRGQHIREYNGDEDYTSNKGENNKSIRNVKSKYSRKSKREEEEETESESESESSDSSSSGSSDSSYSSSE